MRKAFIHLLTITALLSTPACKAANTATVSTEGETNITCNNFDSRFTGNTMRFDFHHAGDSKQEFYYFDKVVREGVWAGSKISLINPFDYGEQHFRIIDTKTGDVLYKNNYCTLFNEWRFPKA